MTASPDRRDFILAGALFTASSYARILGVNGRLCVGGIGMGGRGTGNLKMHHLAGCDMVAV